MSAHVKKNAVIDSTMLGFEDHGIFTFMLGLDYGGTHQGAGLICLSGGRPRTFAEKGLECLVLILETVGVTEWEKLKGRPIVALFDDEDWNSPVRGIENFLGTKRIVWDELFGSQRVEASAL